MVTPLNPVAIYPGDGAAALDVLKLADEYAIAAIKYLQHTRRGEPISSLPYRLLAIHATELYLSAFIVAKIIPRPPVRNMQHSLSLRCEVAIQGGLVLRERTVRHLEDLTTSRDYLVTRYSPEHCHTLCPVSRLTATLLDVKKKVRLSLVGVDFQISTGEEMPHSGGWYENGV